MRSLDWNEEEFVMTQLLPYDYHSELKMMAFYFGVSQDKINEFPAEELQIEVNRKLNETTANLDIPAIVASAVQRARL